MLSPDETNLKELTAACLYQNAQHFVQLNDYQEASKYLEEAFKLTPWDDGLNEIRKSVINKLQSPELYKK